MTKREVELLGMPGLFGRPPEEARKALKTVLAGPLKFTPVDRPEGKRYIVEGMVALDWMYPTEGVPRGKRTDGSAGKAWLGDGDEGTSLLAFEVVG